MRRLVKISFSLFLGAEFFSPPLSNVGYFLLDFMCNNDSHWQKELVVKYLKENLLIPKKIHESAFHSSYWITCAQESKILNSWSFLGISAYVTRIMHGIEKEFF